MLQIRSRPPFKVSLLLFTLDVNKDGLLGLWISALDFFLEPWPKMSYSLKTQSRRDIRKLLKTKNHGTMQTNIFIDTGVHQAATPFVPGF